MKSVLSAAAALLLTVPFTSGVLAQDQLAGRWLCQHANQTVSNNAFENWIYEFALQLQSDGSFQAQGNYNAQTNGFAVPFMAQGQWGRQQGIVVVRGVEQQQGMGSRNFFLMFSNVSERVLSNQYQSANGKLLSHCER